MAKKPTHRARQPSRDTERRLAHFQGSGSELPGPMAGVSGSGSAIRSPRCKFFPMGHLLPVDLTLHLDVPVEGGNEPGRQQLNRAALLIHAQDPAFACCWFSRAIDLGDESGNPAFWMLQKTAIDTWFLCLRRVSGQMAAYHLKSKIKHFPIKLKRGHTTKEFKWPTTITISHGG